VAQGRRLVGATVIDGDERIPDAVVDIEDGRIVGVGPRDAVPARADLVEEDLSGHYLVPGLMDAHVHVAQTPVTYARADDPMGITDALLRSFVSHGVTSVRDPGTPDQGNFYSELREGRPEWPRFFSSGPVIDGPPGVHWSGTRLVETAADARREVDSIVEAGVDLIKTYFWLQPGPFTIVVGAAHDHGLPVAYHPGSVSVTDALDMGVDQVEHLLHSPEMLAPTDSHLADSLPGANWGSLPMFRLWAKVDTGGPAAVRLIDSMARHGTTLTPTLALSAAVLDGPTGKHADHARRSGVPADVMKRWADTAHPEEYGAEDLALAPAILELQLGHVRLARDAGVRLAAGTGGMGHFLAPGASLIDELELLVRAGLSPGEAIVAATRTAADLVGRSGEIGTLAVGARADMVVLRSDPLVDISNMRSTMAVFKDGAVVAGSLEGVARAIG
jgi:imidazolonepropionase-like amidohydrolase